jgi:alkylation response protein AidB-like acyl-CoA dehydrogenase/flavin-dependent dehydrogenase/electron transfer flavoprotein alpha/beta subunit/ferredoxin-like protein FixX
MSSSQYDVLVVGAGAAGLTAAICLARGGFSVAVLEAAVFPGAENWSGCVYFCENLAHPDILGPQGVDALAWERRLVERGFFATDGHGLLGMTYRDSKAFRHCYTVLRPIYDHHLGHMALSHGVTLLTETTAESLIREDDRVIGVCTNRGPLYADLVFLAEGDASHLVTREGYEPFTDQRETPKFLQGIKQVIEMPPRAIESIFGLGPEEGAAYEILIRNGTLRGRSLHLNMGGFVYTNRQSLSVGLVLPVDNLRENFSGDPNLLMEWFENLPALQPWLREGKRGVFGAKIIRGGGAKDIPTLIDNGLAIGGAASAIGIDFPYPNFTGPATKMGLLIAQAAQRIRDHGGGFTRDSLARYYLEPLRQTHYWADVDFLRRWPGYVKRTQVFFDRNLDLILGSAYIWTRPRRWFLTKWTNWLRLLLQFVGPLHWPEMRHDLRHLSRALRLREVADRPALLQVLLDGAVNGLRDFFGRPRPNLPAAGVVRLHYSAAGGEEPSGLPPRLLRRWFRRFAPILAGAAQRVYTNDGQPLWDKLPAAIRLLTRQVNMFDVLGAGAIGLATVISGVLLAGWPRLVEFLFGSRPGKPPRGIFKLYQRITRQTGDLTPTLGNAAQKWEGRLADLAYDSVKSSHIHLLWPKSLAEKDSVTEEGLWHICPAHVYEARVGPLGQIQTVVNFENCIKCETCWRGADWVDWGRDGRHRFTYPVHSPAISKLFETISTPSLSRPTLPRTLDPWEPAARRLAALLQTEPTTSIESEKADLLDGLRHLLGQLEQKLQEFDEALAEEPRTVDRTRQEHLVMLTRYAQQLANRIVEIVQENSWLNQATRAGAEAHEQILILAKALAAKADERTRRTWNRHFSWAAADGRQIRAHHLAGLRRFLDVLSSHFNVSNIHHISPEAALLKPWLKINENSKQADQLSQWSDRLDARLGKAIWRDLEHQIPLTSDHDALLRDLIAQVPPVDPKDLENSLHPPARKALLAELAQRDPSLAYRVASHLWARDLARLAVGPSAWNQWADRWSKGEEWACFAWIEAVSLSSPSGGERNGHKETQWKGETLFIPAGQAESLLLCLGDQMVMVPTATAGLRIEPLASLGLRGAGLARIRLDGFSLPETRTLVDHDRIYRVWAILSSADLISIASGMADLLCQRAVAHATGRVQFPGLFHDEESRDTIGKFGAVKKMIAEMSAGRYLIETLDQCLTPTDFSSASLQRAELIKALVAEILGTAPGSISYNAGQVFGGTGYSEDDFLSKFYRDAAAWRFLGPPNTEVYSRHGQQLWQSWRIDGLRLATLPNEIELFEQVAQRKALQAELDEIRNARSRLRTLIEEWQTSVGSGQTKGHKGEASGGNENTLAQDSISSLPTAHCPLPTADLQEVQEALARQDAYLLANKALLLRSHARLEVGIPAEVETALMRVWLDCSSAALDEFESLLQRTRDSARSRRDRPLVAPAAEPAINTYTDYLAATAPYQSGDFLISSIQLTRPRFVPELLEADPVLADRNREFRELMEGYFRKTRSGSSHCGNYERYIEEHHRPDPADLEFCRDHGFFRMPIARELGGEGRLKVDYYLLTTSIQRLADISLSLTVQVNTGLGTTPVLLARDKDLAKAKKDLGDLISDSALQKQIRRALEDLHGLLALPDTKRLESALQAFDLRIQERILSRPGLKSLAHAFWEEWQQVVRAVNEFDLPFALAHLDRSLSAWKDACTRAGEQLAELARRREAYDLFLRWVAAGQISAFALTEPSAGSDTARVATRARLRSVQVEDGPDGTHCFIPVNGKEPRVLLDAKRLEFPSGVPHYRWSESGRRAPILFDEYDYETDNPRRMRYYEVDGRRVYFTDIGQLRQRDGQIWYDYWELSGAKMWITNGRIAGIMCLYAKTDEGITGFIVDRHAEGLFVGKDEAKMGQCGSPTNELSLQAVRVPRENVIGLEGRGQMNALETLNVGRAGLAMSAMTSMESLIESSRAVARGMFGEIPAWIEWRLNRMEEDRFVAEALAYEIIGRFEHPQTKSVRLESAIAKMLCSELLHRVIERAEEIHGLAGQTQLHLVEKRKRDARVQTIYEGTNEVQRFFILKDLATEVMPRWASNGAPSPHHLSREALEFEALKSQFRQRLTSALEFFGQGLWQKPNLQANCFLLAEAAAWLKAADSVLGRLAWLERQETVGSEQWAVGSKEERPESFQNNPGDNSSLLLPTAHCSLPTALGWRALENCRAEFLNRLKRFDEELIHLRRGFYAPAIRAASLLFQGQGPTASETAQRGWPGLSLRSPAALGRTGTSKTQLRPSHKPLSILVVLEPTAAQVPRPKVVAGRLQEAHFTLSKADEAALEAAFRLRDQAAAPVTIQVAAVGSRAMAPVLRKAISLGVDRARLVILPVDAVTPQCAASALVTVIGTPSSLAPLAPGQRGSGEGGGIDLVLGGAGKGDHEEGLLARLTAQALGIPYAGSATWLALESNGQDSSSLILEQASHQRLRPLPAAAGVEAGLPLREFTVRGYLAGLAKNVEFLRWPKKIEPMEVSLVESASLDGTPRSASEISGLSLSPEEAASHLLREIGQTGSPVSFQQASEVSKTSEVYSVETVSHPSLLENGGVVAVLHSDSTGRLLPSAAAALVTARTLANLAGVEPVTLLLCPQDEQIQRAVLGRLTSLFRGDIVLLPTAAAGRDFEVPARILAECWPQLSPLPRAVVGEHWTEAAFIPLGLRLDTQARLALRVKQVSQDNGKVALITSRANGKLRVEQRVEEPSGLPIWISLAPDAVIESGPETSSPLEAGGESGGRVQRWTPRLERFFGQEEIQRLLDEVKEDTGLAKLSDADFIIDVGFGVGNRDGFEAVIAPLIETLRQLGVRNLVVGGSRKVTEELHLLPPDCQIGQSGVSVNPQILLAIGISGAPQHLNYIGPRAAILAFNRDPETPIMTLNHRQPRPRVFPIVGDLFETVPALIAALRVAEKGRAVTPAVIINQ